MTKTPKRRSTSSSGLRPALAPKSAPARVPGSERSKVGSKAPDGRTPHDKDGNEQLAHELPRRAPS